VHLVTRGHFWSRDKDGGHAIRSVMSENPTIHVNLMAPWCIEPELWAIEVLHCRNTHSTFFAPVTLTLTRWLSYTNLIRIRWRYTGCAYMNFLRQGFLKLSSDIHNTYRQTETHVWSITAHTYNCKI